ncbi:chemotaxis protein [Pinirhizobacter sp.]|jgi:two-component system chemotaxis response regulator CheV|uniref:chemotaxis protein n=1 Tax=Pinirhizobacter sp. TaxID=2950432 RepID=UPI002F42043F
MSGPLLETVERFTRLAGHNRVAMLMFRLGDGQDFGINVFKVREVIRRQRLERMPSMHELIAGSFDYRGQTIPVIDLARAMGYPPLADHPEAHFIVTEFSRSVQAFLVSDVQRIVHCDGAAMAAPPPSLGYGPRVNAVTRLDGNLLAIVDVEQVLASIEPAKVELSSRIGSVPGDARRRPRRVLVADDSMVARTQIVELFRQMNLECVVANDGQEAYERLVALAEGDSDDNVAMVISDIEMPRMDGYALTRAIREDDRLKDMKVLLHSSLSGVFNESMVNQVGADRFIAKFQPDILAAAVVELLPAEEPVRWASL